MYDGSLDIKPFRMRQLQPCSYDLTLSHHLALVRVPESVKEIDIRADNTKYIRHIRNLKSYVLKPDTLVLASTVEYVKLDTKISAQLEGKSSLARLGLMVHSTAGFIDAGFEGTITLELVNMLGTPIRLWTGMAIAQLSVFKLDTPSANPYSGKYLRQVGPTSSRYFQNPRVETDETPT